MVRPREGPDSHGICTKQLFSKLPRYQNEMMAGYGFASPVVSAAILVGLRYTYARYYCKAIRGFDPTQSWHGWGLSSLARSWPVGGEEDLIGTAVMSTALLRATVHAEPPRNRWH